MAMGLLQQVLAAQAFDLREFDPFEIGADRAGWIRRESAARLRHWPEVFEFLPECIRLSPELTHEADRTAALAEVTLGLAGEGAITGWRDETYPVRIRRESAPLCHIERAAMRFFGLTAAAAHLNGYTMKAGGMLVWLARRSRSKAIDPGLLDNLVGGGIASGRDAWQTLLRECGEEAGIGLDLAARASPVETLYVCREVPEGLHREIVYSHDLELPEEFTPLNNDGEVSEFMRLDATAVLERTARGELTVEAGLVALDFLLRHRAIALPDPGIRAALDRCRLPS